MYVHSKNRLKIEAFFSAHCLSQSQEGPTINGVPYIFPYHKNMVVLLKQKRGAGVCSLCKYAVPFPVGHE